MKPKLNILTKQLNCDTLVFDDFENLKSGNINVNTDLFDATEFCKAEGVEEPAYYQFNTACQRHIAAKLKELNIKPSEIFYQNKDGHTLIHVALCLIYIRYVSENISAYFDSLVATCLLTGIAMSDSAILNMAANRLPDNVLQDMMTTRKNNNESE